MQLLVPPLDDRSADFQMEDGSPDTSNSVPAARSVMSQGLQDKFKTMKQAWNNNNKRSEASASSSSNEDQDDSADQDNVHQEADNSSHHHHHQNKKRKIAMETAFAIESEVLKWQRGIAELEAMLEVGGDDEDDDDDAPSSSSDQDAANAARPPEVVRFPALPPIIPAEVGELEENGNSEDDDEGEWRSNKTAIKTKTKNNNSNK